MKRVELFLLLILLLSCGYEDNQFKEKGGDFVIDLIENGDILTLEVNNSYELDYSGNINSIELNTDHLFFVDTEQSYVGRFDIKQNKLSSIGKSGRGPFEFIQPDIIRIYNSNIYIWDSAQLKFLIFDYESNELFESENLSRSLSDFHVINEDSLALYMSGGFEGSSVGIYSLSRATVLQNSLTGVQTNTDIALAILKGTGSIYSKYPYLYYVLPGALNIHKVHTDTNEETVIKLGSSDFAVDKIDNVKDLVNNRRDELFPYLMNNSSTLELSFKNNMYFLATVNGNTYIDSNSTSNEVNYDDRYYMFYIFDEDLSNVGYIKKEFDPSNYYKFQNGYLYEVITIDEGGYRINQYVIN